MNRMNTVLKRVNALLRRLTVTLHNAECTVLKKLTAKVETRLRRSKFGAATPGHALENHTLFRVAATDSVFMITSVS